MRVVAVFLLLATAATLAQAPSKPPAGGLTFEVVSIKRNTSGALGSNGSSQRPDGGFTLLNVPVMTLIGRAQVLPIVPADMVGLPEWAQRDRYDVSATSPLSRTATADERAAMLRAMLTDRFKLVAHIEKREGPAYDLVLARSDRRLGPGIKPSERDCVTNAASPVCGPLRMGNGLEGDMTMESFAFMLRPMAGRPIVDRTGLSGSYRITVQFDISAALTGPDTAPSAGGLPSLFSALPDQLGLKLESSQAERDVLVIDRLERPTEN